MKYRCMGKDKGKDGKLQLCLKEFTTQKEAQEHVDKLEHEENNGYWWV